MGRLLGFGGDAHALLQPALPAAVRDRRRGSAAHLGAACGRPEQPDGTGDQDRVRLGADDSIRRHEGRIRALACSSLLFAWFVFYVPDYLGHPDNYVEANPLSTPPHIVPEWYFLPYYAILRAIPNKLLGVIAMFSSILILLFVPWLDTSRVRSSKYRPIYKWFFWLFIISVISLGYLGSKPPEGVLRVLGPRLHGLLFPALPGDHADRRRDREPRRRCRARSPSRCWARAASRCV